MLDEGFKRQEMSKGGKKFYRTNREVILSSNTPLDIQKVLQCCLEIAVLFVDGVGLDQATCCRPAKDRHNDYVCTTTGEPMKQQAIQIRNGLNLLSISHIVTPVDRACHQPQCKVHGIYK